jgi:tripartite-type tricarboxylate transporter receptor subunit TctC
MKRLIGLAIALLMCVAGPALAQDYPARPIRILVPYAPGGISDIAARIVGAKLTEAWGQQVVIENRPGANGFIAVTDAARAAPDGYTLVMVTTGDVAVNPALFKDVPYDVERDLAPMTATLAQEGAGDISASNWTALLAPKGTPQPIIDKLSAKVVEILNMPDVKTRFGAGGVSTIPSTPAELEAKIKRELATYRLVIEKSNVRLD